jgi:hypothetical protein
MVAEIANVGDTVLVLVPWVFANAPVDNARKPATNRINDRFIGFCCPILVF